MKHFYQLLVGVVLLFMYGCSDERPLEEESMLTEQRLEDARIIKLEPQPGAIKTPFQFNAGEKSPKKTVYLSLYSADYLTHTESGKAGNTVFFRDVGNKQIPIDHVPFASLDGTSNISYFIAGNRISKDLQPEISSQAIHRAMDTWNEVTCSNPGIFELDYAEGTPAGIVLRFLQDQGMLLDEPEGSNEYRADIAHIGWVPPEFFEILLGEGAENVIAATFFFIFVDEDGPTDLDNNGKLDMALSEIYYNDRFPWNDGDHIDVETVALHEAGHGLGQAHFGKLFQINSTGRFQFAPRAVMNAGYTGIQTQITKTDEAGHCSNWANWPLH